MPAKGQDAHRSSSSPAPASGPGPCRPPGSLFLGCRLPGVEVCGAAWHKSCRVFIFPRLLPGTVSCSPRLDRLWSERREAFRAHRGSEGPVWPAGGKDARYISAPACSASTRATSACMIVASPHPGAGGGRRQPGHSPPGLAPGAGCCPASTRPVLCSGAQVPGMNRVLGGAGTWGLMAHAMLVGCRGDDRQPFPAPGLRLVVSRSLNSRAHTAECRRTFPARRPTSFPLRGTSKHAACSSLPLFLGSVCLSGCPRGARWRWAQLWAYEVGGGGRSRGPCRPPKPSSPSVCLLECLL